MKQASTSQTYAAETSSNKGWYRVMRSTNVTMPSAATFRRSSKTESYLAASSSLRVIFASVVGGNPSVDDSATITSTSSPRYWRAAMRLCPSMATKFPSSSFRTSGVGGKSSVLPSRRQEKINFTVRSFRKSCDGAIFSGDIDISIEQLYQGSRGLEPMYQIRNLDQTKVPRM